MSQTGPWSVKGIDQRARDAAREAAGAEGMTLGEYLNKLLLAADHQEPNEISRAYTTPQPKPDAASSTLDHITRRIEATEARSTLAITGMDQTVLGLVARLENAEQTTASIAGHVEGVIDELKQTHEALQAKVARLEGDENQKQNLEALKSLENALGVLASHVYEENELTHNETDAIKGRVEAGFSDVGERVEAMETKVEETLAGAASRVERAVEQAELRAEGTARHLSERMSYLESGVSERLANIGNHEERLTAVETDVSGALESMEGTLLRIQDRLNRAETTTDAALQSLESTFEHLDKRIEAVASTVDPELADRLRAEFEARFEDISASVQATVENARQELAEEISRAASGFDEADIADIKNDLSSVSRRLTESDEKQSRAIDAVGNQMSRLSASVDERMAEVEALSDIATTEAVREQIDRLSENVSEKIETLAEHVDARVTESEQRSADAIEQVGVQVANVTTRLQARQEEAIKLLQKEMDETHKRSDARLSDALANVSERLETMQTQTSDSLSPVQRAIASLATRLENVEEFVTPPHAEELHAHPPADAEASEIDEPEFEAGLPVFEEPYDHASEHMDTATVVDESTSEPQDEFESLHDPRSTLSAFNDDRPDDNGVSFEEEWEVHPQAQDRYKDDFEAISAAASAITSEDIPSEDYVSGEPETYSPFEDAEDPLAELGEIDNGASETRDSDIFDQNFEDAPAGEAVDPQAPFDSAQLRETVETDAATSDYISRARKAAIAASEPGVASPAATTRPGGRGKGGGPGGSGGSGSRTSGSKAPLYAAASAVVITGAAVGGYWALRGKQAAPVQVASVDTYQDPADVSSTPENMDDLTTRVSIESTATDDLLDTDATADANTEADLFDPQPVQSETVDTTSASYPPIPDAMTVAQAANSGNHIAQYQLGQSRIEEGALQDGANLIRKSAQKGLPVAQYRLAKLHEKGIGVPKDLTLAREWTEKAARGGNVKAMHDLAVFMAEGEGGEQSYAGAVEWFRKAAEFDVVDSQYNLGVLYERGLGISPNLTEALFWFHIAASNNDAGAPSKIQDISARVSSEAAEQTSARAKSWRSARENAIANGRFGAQPWNSGNPLQTRGVQVALNALGYDVGEPDGVMGPATERAVRTYQSQNNLAVDGKIQSELIQHMNMRASGDARGIQ